MKRKPSFLFWVGTLLLASVAVSDLLLHLPPSVFTLGVGVGTACVSWGLAARRKQDVP